MKKYKDYIYWEDLIKDIEESSDVVYTSMGSESSHKGLSIGGKLPFSISEYEFNYIKNFIIANNLKSGLDVATGIAIGTISSALGFRETGGALLSIDSYIEEETQDQFKGELYQEIQLLEPYNRNKKVVHSLELSGITDMRKGWFPKDLSLNRKFDFVLLDCPKSVGDFEVMSRAIVGALDTKFAVFVHDTHVYHDSFIEAANRLYGVCPIFLTNFDFGVVKAIQRYPLALVTNLEGY